jgi:FixJ family two-component response regulator
LEVLTKRERELLEHIEWGFSDRAIAAGLRNMVPSETGDREPLQTSSGGFERSREQAAMIRAEVRQK